MSRKGYTNAVKSSTAGELAVNDSYPVSNVELRAIKKQSQFTKRLLRPPPLDEVADAAGYS
ncbi:MAG TPA: hypothetical protein VMX36_12870 [Sedimentisphaerales bacterium]|nr:hypothetical protein [Sedimentisphaerales bacterium]